MLPKFHIIIGLIFSLLVLILSPSIGLPGFFIILASSVLIDVDHYLYYVCKKHDLSLKNAYNWFISKNKFMKSLPLKQREKYKKVIIIFHGIEFWSIIFILSFFHKIFLFVLLGIIIHLIADFIWLFLEKGSLYQKLSQVNIYLKNKGKKDLFSEL